MLVFVLAFITLCPFWFCNYLDVCAYSMSIKISCASSRSSNKNRDYSNKQKVSYMQCAFHFEIATALKFIYLCNFNADNTFILAIQSAILPCGLQKHK